MTLKLVKIEDGLLEQDNFYSVSPSSNFIGDFHYTRDALGSFSLTGGFIERKFEYNEFVIVVEKETNFITNDDGVYLYVRKDHQRAGLIEEKKDVFPPNPYWKLIKADGFIQGYSSSDGVNWFHKGGGEIFNNDVQGFQVFGSTHMKLIDYKVYKTPYFKIYGFPEDYQVIIEDIGGNIIKTGIFDSDHKSEIFLDYCFEGRIKILDNNGSFIYDTNVMDIKFGDVYTATDYDLQVIYKGVVLDYNPTMLNTLTERVVLKNNSVSDTYTNLHIRAIPANTDTVEISLDNINYSNALILDSISPQQEIDLYIRIEKDRSVLFYGTHHFILEID